MITKDILISFLSISISVLIHNNKALSEISMLTQ